MKNVLIWIVVIAAIIIIAMGSGSSGESRSNPGGTRSHAPASYRF